MEINDRLVELKSKIKKDKAPQSETIRTILSWFNAERRGIHVIKQVERKLDEHDLITIPPFSEPWIDGTVEINISNEGRESKSNYDSMTARLVHLDSANHTPVSVKSESLLKEATAKMLANDFSQLPVMRNERTVEGFISWQTIGEAKALGKQCLQVSECMKTEVQILDANTPLTDAIDQIIKHEFIMVQDSKKLIRGPVTTTDLSVEYHKTAKPFLLIGQIESAIRNILDALAPIELLRSAKHGNDNRAVERPEDLTFSEYKTVIANDELWDKLNVSICKSEVLKVLENVRVARNEVMHFHPDYESNQGIKVLQNASVFFEKLAEVAIVRSAI